MLCVMIVLLYTSGAIFARDLNNARKEERNIGLELDKQGPEVGDSPCVGPVVLLGVVSGSPNLRDSNPMAGIRVDHPLHAAMKSNDGTYASSLDKSGKLYREKKQREQTGKSLEKRIPEQTNRISHLKKWVDSAQKSYDYEMDKREPDYERRNELKKKLDDITAKYKNAELKLEEMIKKQGENSTRLSTVTSDYNSVQQTLSPYYNEHSRIISEAQGLIDKHGCDN